LIDLLAVVEVIVYQPSVGIESCHLFRSGFEDFGKRRMDMDHVGEFGKSGVLAHQNRNLLDDVGGVGTVGVTAHDPSIVGRSEELQHTLGLTHGEGLAVGTPEGLLADVRDAISLELVLRGANTAIQITCYDRSGKEVKRVTSTDPGTIEDPENQNVGGQSGNGGNQGGGGGNSHNDDDDIITD
jgi:hypothetical protein